MRKFLIRSLFGLLPLFVVGGFNYATDIYHIFNPDAQLVQVAQWAKEGHHAAYERSYDRMNLLTQCIRQSFQTTEFAVLGSSKSMVVDAKTIGSTSFFNYWITHARMQDYLSVIYQLDQKNILPDTLLLEISPLLFNPNRKVARHHYDHRAYFDMLDKLELPKADYDFWSNFSMKTTQLFSGSNFLDIFLKERIPNFSQTSSYSGADQPIVRSDGSVWLPDYKEKDKENRKRLILDEKVDNQHLFHKIDGILAQQFEALVEFLIRKKVNIVLFVPSYHPETYNIIIKRNPVFVDLNNYYLSLSDKYDLPIFGNLDGSIYRLKDEEFRDGAHMKQVGFEKIWKQRTMENGWK